MEVKIKKMVFWIVTSCVSKGCMAPISGGRVTHARNQQKHVTIRDQIFILFGSEDGRNMFFRNFGLFPNYPEL
jgi:hypothetical protein